MSRIPWGKSNWSKGSRINESVVKLALALKEGCWNIASCIFWLKIEQRSWKTSGAGGLLDIICESILCIYIYLFMIIYIYIYIHTYRERYHNLQWCGKSGIPNEYGQLDGETSTLPIGGFPSIPTNFVAHVIHGWIQIDKIDRIDEWMETNR